MKNSPTIFLSFNPNSEIEETLVIRLHTIGAVHGFQMLLPERPSKSASISEQTKSRINLSNYFLVFSTQNISRVVKEEINYAFEKFKDKSRIIVILDKRNIKKPITIPNCTEIVIDSQNHNEYIINQILEKLKSAQKASNSKKKTSLHKDDNNDVVGGILLAGLSLLLLGALFSNKK